MIKIGKVEGDVIEQGGIKNQTIVQGGNPTIINDGDRQSTLTAGQQADSAPATTPRISRPRVLAEEVLNLVAEGMISQPSDLCVIYKLEQEFPLVGFRSPKDFIERFPTMLPQPLPAELMPNANNFKHINLGSNNYPDWPLKDNADINTVHFKALAEAFIDDMKALGFVHPSLRA